jgi:hypothetical protein
MRFPAVITFPNPEEGIEAEVLAPSLWSWEELSKVRDKIGSAAFDMLYQGIPRPEGGGLFDVEVFRKARDERLPAWRGFREAAMEGVEEEGLGRLPPFVRVCAMDPAYVGYYGVVVADVCHRTGEIVVLASYRKRAGEDPNKFLEEAYELIRKHRIEYLIVEGSLGFPKWMKVSKWWSRIFDGAPNAPRYIEHMTTGQSKHNMEYGLLSLAAECESRRIRFPYADAAGRAMTDMVEEEVSLYEQGSGHGGLDDILHALWFIRFNIRKLRPRRPLAPAKPQKFSDLNASGRRIWLKQHGGWGETSAERQEREDQRRHKEKLAKEAWRAAAEAAAYDDGFEEEEEV